jgi:phospholipase/carboxylesterase
MLQGTEEPIVPLKLARAAGSKLRTLGYQVEWQEYEMPHSVCAEEVAHIGLWLRRMVGG